MQRRGNRRGWRRDCGRRGRRPGRRGGRRRRKRRHRRGSFWTSRARAGGRRPSARARPGGAMQQPNHDEVGPLRQQGHPSNDELLKLRAPVNSFMDSAISRAQVERWASVFASLARCAKLPSASLGVSSWRKV